MYRLHALLAHRRHSAAGPPDWVFTFLVKTTCHCIKLIVIFIIDTAGIKIAFSVINILIIVIAMIIVIATIVVVVIPLNEERYMTI